MIDMSILWALVLALFALNHEPSNAKTERQSTRSVPDIRQLSLLKLPVTQSFNARFRRRSWRRIRSGFCQMASRRHAHFTRRDSRSCSCKYCDGLLAG
jgi:hypothetical protein